MPNTAAPVEPLFTNVSSLEEVPAVAAYLRRIGGRASSFRSAVIETAEGRYSREIGRVRFDRDGGIHAPEEFAPTEAEAAAISEALRRVRFPDHVTLAALAGLPPELEGAARDDVFEFRGTDGRIVMLQRRVEHPDGGKRYEPWTYWSDGEWRKMEPEGLLPLWGLDQLQDHSVVFLHEGAKAARHVRRLLENGTALRGHPWGEHLRHSAHLGWIGGAPNPQRTDWGPLKRGDVARVYVVCDNDQLGKDAVAAISRELKRPMMAVMFDRRFADGFDLADPFPTSLFKARGQELIYAGPSFADCCRPATWATDVRPNPSGRGRPIYELRSHFVEEWRASVSPPVFVHRDRPSRLYGAPEFNAAVRAFSDAEDTARLLLRRPGSVLAGIAYQPGRPTGAVSGDGEQRFNTCAATLIRPKRGDPAPFLRFMTHLFPVKRDRREVLKWCATLIARPGIRMQYALLLMSETQGVGKTTLGESVLAPLVGRDNVSTPSETAVVDSSFNGWIAHKRLVLINEIYAGQSRKAYDKIKSLITDRRVEVNVKFQPAYDLDNWAHFVASSNSKLALFMDDTDRRWFVPEVAEKTRPRVFWTALHEWLAGDGLAVIHQWALDYVERHGPVMTGDRAPASAAKTALIEASMSEGKRLVRDLADAVMGRASGPEPQRIILTVRDVRGWLAEKRGLQPADRRLESERTVQDVLRKAGLTVVAGDQRFRIGDVKVAVACNFTPEPGAKWPDLSRHLTTVTALMGVPDDPF